MRECETKRKLRNEGYPTAGAGISYRVEFYFGPCFLFGPFFAFCPPRPVIYAGCWLHVSPRCGAVRNFR